jgi:hypothetical protein
LCSKANHSEVVVMRFARSLSVVLSVVALGLAAGCSNAAGGDDTASGEDAVIQGDNKEQARSVTGEIDGQAGSAQTTIKLRLQNTTIEAVKAKVADRELGLWKSLKRPGELKIGKETIKMGGAGGALFTDLKRDGQTVEAFMPFAESGLRSYSGLKFKFSYTMTDSADGFTLDVSNSSKVETKLLAVDVIDANKLTFKLTATKAGDDVAIEIQETVSVLKAKDKVGKLLGCAVAVADALEARQQ